MILYVQGANQKREVSQTSRGREILALKGLTFYGCYQTARPFGGKKNKNRLDSSGISDKLNFMEFASPEPKRRVVLGDLQKDKNGRTVQYIYEPVKDPEFMSTDELRELKPVATVVHASDNDRQNFPDAPPYIVHFPTQSREEREWLLGIVDEEILREFGEG